MRPPNRVGFFVPARLGQREYRQLLTTRWKLGRPLVGNTRNDIVQRLVHLRQSVIGFLK